MLKLTFKILAGIIMLLPYPFKSTKRAEGILSLQVDKHIAFGSITLARHAFNVKIHKYHIEHFKSLHLQTKF